MPFRFSPVIAVDVPDLDAAVAHYVDVMGMTVTSRGATEVELRLGDVTFYLQQGPEARSYLDFAVADLPEAVARLEADGCSLRPTRTPEGQRSYLVSDPHGLRYHLFESDEASGG